MTGFVDLDRARLLDVVPGRSAEAAGDWLASMPIRWRQQVVVAALDAFWGYNTALVANLPNATVVMDRLCRISHKWSYGRAGIMARVGLRALAGRPSRRC